MNHTSTGGSGTALHAPGVQEAFQNNPTFLPHATARSFSYVAMSPECKTEAASQKKRHCNRTLGLQGAGHDRIQQSNSRLFEDCALNPTRLPHRFTSICMFEALVGGDPNLENHIRHAHPPP